ncbi:unnamed protein product [Enterobius vermicularis]|uniref:Transmembrane protein n=1 Tax=Enterobius vermicularis TaxID=51028 RepID=A0A0N4V7M8_ENTVE|nr:unnamed protein product [Enterobius vermicularis]
MFAGSKYRIELSKFSLLQDYKQMTISLRRSLELVISAVLLISAYLQFTRDPDWWIYVPIYGLGAALCLFPAQNSVWWRFSSAVVIVFGGLQIAFISWSLWHVSKIALSEKFEEVRLLQIYVYVLEVPPVVSAFRSKIPPS